MLPPRAWKAFERISVDVSTSSPRLWKTKKCSDVLPLKQLGLSPQTQGRVSEHWGGPIAAPFTLTSEVRFLRVSLGVSQPLQGLTCTGIGRGALAADQDERGAPKLQLQSLPGGSRGKNRVDCTWHPCSVVLQSTEREYHVPDGQMWLHSAGLCIPMPYTLGGRRHPRSPTTLPTPLLPSHHQSWGAIEVAAPRLPSC